MKRIYHNILISSVIALLILVQCDPWDFKMKITNNSNSTIYFFDSFAYPDTIIRPEENPINIPETNSVLPGSTRANRMRGSWESKFEIRDTLMIFIFDETTLRTVPWDTIRKNYMILKRYDLSLEDLVKMDWRVTYP
ncbi:MAG: hypothetical protein GT598_15370 [Bacteroidales bacterium]|nr:hypothetical protein [Bacteroidales bacterium]